MIRRLLYALADRLPCRIISDDGTPYLERYFLFRAAGVQCYLHRFVGSDPDCGLHDHPWRWAASLILAGWYLEERRRKDLTPRRVRWFNLITGDTFHRVVMPDGARDVWTLFVHGPVVKRWGFLREEGRAGFWWWAPYTYPAGATVAGDWWTTAPKGRDCERRMAA